MSRRAPAGHFLRELELNQFIPIDPTEKQAAFLMISAFDVFYGGAGGGGKTYANLAAALQYAHVPGYAAVIIRRNLSDLEEPGQAIPLSKEWLSGMGAAAVYSGKYHRWTFRTDQVSQPATLSFKYLREGNVSWTRGPAFDYVGIEEATELEEQHIGMSMTRIRRTVKSVIPPRLRMYSNPGGPGHAMLYNRYIKPLSPDPDRYVVLARMEDNPHLDLVEYRKRLDGVRLIDPVLAAQIESGDWEARHGSSLFDPSKVRFIGDVPGDLFAACRFWDLAATVPSKANRDPDFTFGGFMGLRGSRDRPTLVLLGGVRVRRDPEEVQGLMRSTGEADRALLGKIGYRLRWEREGGSAGKFTEADIVRRLGGFDARGVPKTSKDSKRAMWSPLAVQVNAGNVECLRTGDISRDDWIQPTLQEMGSAPNGQHDDTLDGFAGAYHELAGPQAHSGIAAYYKRRADERRAQEAAARR